MITLLTLTATLSTLVNSNNIFSDFASSICQQRYDLDRSVVCQPNGEFAARQCPPNSDICYCSTETGEVIEGTRHTRDKEYLCQNVIYIIEYKHAHRNAGFDVNDMLTDENQLIRKLMDADKRSAVWEMQSIVVTRESGETQYSVYQAAVAGYNTRLTPEEVLKKIRNALGVSEDTLRHLKVVKIYDSVHEGECPAEQAACDETARECYSDSECKLNEVCCLTDCDSRCVAFSSAGTTATPDPPAEVTSPIFQTSELFTSEVQLGGRTDEITASTTAVWYMTSEAGTETASVTTARETEVLTSHDWSTTDSTEEGPDTTEPGSTTEQLPSERPTTQPLSTEEIKLTSTVSSTPSDKITTEASGKTTTEEILDFETTKTPLPVDPTEKATTTRLRIPDPTTPETTTTNFLPGPTTAETTTPETTTNFLPDPTTPETTTPFLPDTTEAATLPITSDKSDSRSTPTPSESEPVPTTVRTTFVQSLGTDEKTKTSALLLDSTTETPTDDFIPSSSIATEDTKFTTDVTGFGTGPSSTVMDRGGDSTMALTVSDSPTFIDGETDPITYFTEEITTSSKRSTSEEGRQTLTIDDRQTLTIDDRQTLTPDYTTQPTEDVPTTTALMPLCEQESYAAISEGREGPLCLDDGSFSPQQCDSVRDICWCVDDKGLEMMGSRRYGSADCDGFRVTTAPATTTEPLGDCWKAYQRAVKEQAYDRGVSLPSCQSNGLYHKSQCHGTFCWCVDEFSGSMVNGTKKPGPIDCDMYMSGVCPEYARDQQSVCMNKCDTDEHCYGTTKCCQTHCGRDCVYPQLPEQMKEGQCPPPKSLNTIFERCTVDCSRDEQCEGSSKCCFNGCGYSCDEPFYDINVYCKKIETLHKGTIGDPREQYSEGDVLQLSCDHGYELQGHAEITCLASGDWEYDLPVCKRINCGVPGSGQFVISRGSDYWVGGVVTYHCYSGYALVGNSSATCLVSGRWDSEPPTCKRRECPVMNELPYGRVYGNLVTYGNRIGFRCDYGYTLIGSEQRLCLSDGSWSGTDPSCVRGYFSRTRRHKFSQLQYDEGAVEKETCQYEAVDTIDYNGDCIEDIWTIQCSCGEPNSVEQKVKIRCQRGELEFIERTVKIGTDCSCCQ